MEEYGTSNFTFKYGIHTISIDYLYGHGPDSEIKIVSLEIQFDIFGYLFKKLPFLKCKVDQIYFELNTKASRNYNCDKNVNINYNSSSGDLNSIIKAQRKKNPHKLRIHRQLSQSQDTPLELNDNQEKSKNEAIPNDSQTQQNSFPKEAPNQTPKEELKSDQNPLEKWIARRLLGFVLAIFVRSAQIDSKLFTFKIGSLSLNIKNISVFYNRSATSIISHIHFNEISFTSDKKLPFSLDSQQKTDENNNNNNKDENDNNINEKTDDSEGTALFRIPDISVTITSDTQSFKYFLGGMLSQFRIKIEEINVDYSDGQMSVSSIQAQMFVRNDPSSKTHVNISQILILFPVADFYTKTFSGTVNDIVLSLESGKFISGPILITRNEQPLFSSHSMKYRKGKADFEYLDATISTPLIIDLSLFKKYFGVLNEEIERDINRFKNVTDSRNSFMKVENNEGSEENIPINPNDDSVNSNFFNSTDSSLTLNSNISENMSGFDDQSEIQNEIEIDIEKYDQKQNADEESGDESRNEEFGTFYDFTDDSWTQGSENSSNYKFSVEDGIYYKNKPGLSGNSSNSAHKKKRLHRKKNQNSLIINSTTAILRFNLSDNHILAFNIRQLSYSNNLITAKSFTLDASFTDSQHFTSPFHDSTINEELKNSSSKLAYIEHRTAANLNDEDYYEYSKKHQKLIHRFCECHHASLNYASPLVAFKCSTGNFFFTNEFAEASFIQEFLALFRFIHNQTKTITKSVYGSEQIVSRNSSTISLPNENNNENNDDLEDEEDEDNKALTQYCFSCDIHKFMVEMKTNALVSKIQRSIEAKRLAIEGLQVRQEKAIQIMDANILNESNSSSSFSLNDFEQSSRKMLFDLYKSSISKVQTPKDDDLYYVVSKDFHASFDGPKIKDRKQGIDELKHAVNFVRKKNDILEQLKQRNKLGDIDEEYENNSEDENENENEIEIPLNDHSNIDSQTDVFEKEDEEFDKDEFEDVNKKIGVFDCGLINISASCISISSPRIGTISTLKTVKTNGTMMVLKQKAVKNDDIYHFPIHCDQKSIEFMIPRVSHRTLTAFNIEECLCDDAYFKYSAALRELQQDFFFGTLVFRRNKFSFKRLEFFDNMRLRYRLKLNMNIKSLDVDYNTKYDAFSQYPLFRVQLPNLKVVCDDNETFQLSSDNINLKILNSEQLDYSFLLTLPSSTMRLKCISYNSIYDNVLQNISKKLNDNNDQNKLKFNKDELLLLKCHCKKRPLLIPIHGYRMNDPSYDPYKMFRSQSFSVHFILNFDKTQTASLNLDYLQPVIDAFLAKKPLRAQFITPIKYINHYFCPKLNFVDFSIKFPGILTTMNRGKMFSRINGDTILLKFNNRNIHSKQHSESSNIFRGQTKKTFSLDVIGKNMIVIATNEERLLYDFQISSVNVNYEKGYSIDVNIGNITSELSHRIINLLANPPIVKMKSSKKKTKPTKPNSTALPLNITMPPNSDSDKNNQADSQNDEDDVTNSSYFTFSFPKYENHTELPVFDRDDQFQMLFKKRKIVIKIDTATTTLRFNNNKTMKSKATAIRFEQRIIPKDDEDIDKHRKSNMINFDYNLCPPLQSISADSFILTTSKNGIDLLNLEKPYFSFSKATNLTYYQIIGASLSVCPSEEDLTFFIPTVKNFFDDLYSLHTEKQRKEYEKSLQTQPKADVKPPLRAVISSSYLKQFTVRFVSNDLINLGTMTGDDFIIQIRRSHELLEIGQIMIRKITAVNETNTKDSFKNVIETTKEPFLTVKYDKPPIHMKNSFIQSIRIMINPFKLRIDTSYFKRLNAEFPSASLLRVFILEGSLGNGEEDLKNNDGEYFESSEIGNAENDANKDSKKAKTRTKHSNTMTHSSSGHFGIISEFESPKAVRSNSVYNDDNFYDEDKKKKKKDKGKTASESDTESKKYEKSEKKRQKKEKKERKKENKRLAKESFINRALRLKNIFFCQHFTFSELPIEVSFRGYNDNGSSSKDNLNNQTPAYLIMDRNMQIGNLEIVDFYGDYKMLLNDISWHLKSSYFRSLSSLLFKKRKNSTAASQPKSES